MKPHPNLALPLAVCLALLLISCKKPKTANFPDTTQDPVPHTQVNLATPIPVDYRRVENGSIISTNKYVDQPYIVKLANGSWLCAYTTSNTWEGGIGETISISISKDKGLTWTYTTDLEPTSGPSAFYSLPFVTSYGRVYVFYGYNTDNTMPASNPIMRTDAVGNMVYKYSDDNGITWSARQVINIPISQADLTNDWQGKYQEWWSICKPIVGSDNQMYFAFTKLQKYLYWNGEGWFVNCPNINTEMDATKLVWNFRPGNNQGLRQFDMGPIQEEHNIVQLSNGSFACLFRTHYGYMGISYSADSCKTWSTPRILTFNNGLTAYNPRACARIFKFSNGKYALWFENNSINPDNALHRDPAWISGGTEVNGRINWSMPEVLLYSRDTTLGFSYPDIIEDGGRYYLAETQKTIARIHNISSHLLNSLWTQGTIKTHSTSKLMADIPSAKLNDVPAQPYSYTNSTVSSFSLNFNLTLSSYSKRTDGETLLAFTSRTTADTLIKIRNLASKTLSIEIYHGGKLLTNYYLDNTLIKLNTPLFISVSLDPSDGILTSMVNGVLCNGIAGRACGFAIVPPSFDFSDISGNVFAKQFSGTVNQLQVYDRAFTTADMLSEYLAYKN